MSIERIMFIVPHDQLWIFKGWITYHEYTAMRLVSKNWSRFVDQFGDSYWEDTLLNSHLFRMILQEEISLIKLETEESIKLASGKRLYKFWKNLYSCLKKKMEPTIYVKPVVPCMREVTFYVFGHYCTHCTRYWSRFNNGIFQCYSGDRKTVDSGIEESLLQC